MSSEPKLRLSNSSLESAFKTKPHLEKYASRLRALDKNKNGELSLEEVAECVEELVSYEKSHRIFKRVLIASSILLILAVAAIVGLTYAIVSLTQPMKVQNGVLMSSNGQPVVTSIPVLSVNASAMENAAIASGKRRALLAADTCYDQRVGLVGLFGALISVCGLMDLGVGGNTFILDVSDPNCVINLTESCFHRRVTLAIDYSQCRTLLDSGDIPECFDSNNNPEVTLTILRGADSTNPTERYSVTAQYSCDTYEWAPVAMVTHQVCSSASSPSPSPSGIGATPSASSPPADSSISIPGVTNVTSCSNGTYWDYTRSICTTNPKIEHCTKVQYRDAYTPNCQECEGFFLVQNGVCACSSAVTFQTSDGSCLCRNDPEVPIEEIYDGISQCSKQSNEVGAVCRSGYVGFSCDMYVQPLEPIDIASLLNYTSATPSRSPSTGRSPRQG